MKREVVLSLCMIVRDEERYLGDCLASVRHVVDEIIIVDTGSTDATLDVARNYGASTFHLPWPDDFAQARNESLRHATGKWVLYLDADERLSKESKAAVRKVVKRCSEPYVRVTIRSHDADERSVHITSGHRLFQNVPGVRFSGAVHESVAPFFQAMNCEEHVSDICITHLGYAKSEEEMQEKQARNRRLLQTQLRNEPENPIWHYFLAQNLIIDQQYKRALTVLETALKLGGLPRDMEVSCYNNLAEVNLNLGDLTAAAAFAKKSLANDSDQTMAHLLLFKIYEKQSDVSSQINCLENVRINMECQERRAAEHISIDASVQPSLIYINLGRLYAAQGLLEKARNCFALAAEREPQNLTAVVSLAEVLLTLHRIGEASHVLETINFSTISQPVMLQKVAWLAIKCQSDLIAISSLTRLEQIMPDNYHIRKHLAGLHHKNGNHQQARHYLSLIRPESA